jgi:RNA polymerase sigma factor (sigma-70 family)
MSNEETARQVRRAQAGDLEAFNWIVRRFQDRAVAYAATVLGSFHGGQDAAQEAFLEAYRTLHTLRAPEAFPVWFRKVVFKQCDRLIRNKQVSTVPIQTAEHLPSSAPAPEEIAERHRIQEEVSRAIQSLPEGQRAVITLFYMGEHSHQDIAEFLDLPVTTVKSRLHQGRRQLKGEMLAMVNNDLSESRPSQSDAFVSRVNESIAKALPSVTPDTGREMFYAEHPVYSLQNSFLVWAIEAKASELRFLPERGQVTVQLHGAGSPDQVISLPKPLQEPIAFRIKVSAEMDVSQTDVPQEGKIPIRYNGADYDALVSGRPTEHGERITIRIVQK